MLDSVSVDGIAYPVDRKEDRDGMGVTYSVERVPEITVRLRYDEHYDSSDALDYCRVGRMLIVHRNYVLGDDHEQPITSTDCPKCEGSGWDERPSEGYPDGAPCPKCEGRGWVDDGIIAWAQREHGATVVLPLWMYEHGGITIRAGSSFDAGNPYGDPWDSGMCGIVFDTAEGRETTGVRAEDVEQALREEVAEYDRYLQGEVYYLSVDAPGYDEPTLGGLVGIEAAEEAVSEAIADAITCALHERAEAAYNAARDIITI